MKLELSLLAASLAVLPVRLARAEERHPQPLPLTALARSMRALKSGGPVQPISAAELARDAENNVRELVRYATEEDPRVQAYALALLAEVGRRTKDSAARKAAAAALLERALGGAGPAAHRALASLAGFEADDFPADARERIQRRLSSERPPAALMRLAGAAGAVECRPRLAALAVEPSLSRNERWSAALALARLGSEAHARRCIETFRAEPDLPRRCSALLSDLTWTRHPLALEVLAAELASTARTADLQDVPGVPVSQYAAHAAAQWLPACPIEPFYAGGYRPEQVAGLRAWLRARQVKREAEPPENRSQANQGSRS